MKQNIVKPNVLFQCIYPYIQYCIYLDSSSAALPFLLTAQNTLSLQFFQILRFDNMYGISSVKPEKMGNNMGIV